MNQDVLISIRDVSMNYGTGRQDAIEHVSVDIKKGEILALVGSNGSGKSTLMKGMLGLMPFTCGEMERKKGLKVGYMAQMLTREMLSTLIWRYAAMRYEYDYHERFDAEEAFTEADPVSGWAQEAMRLMEIEDLGRQHIGALSGGQLQRVLLARAIAGEPELLVLDEPCSALDHDTTEALLKLFTRLRDEKHTSIVISTHDWHFVRHNADRVLVLNHHLEYVGDINGWNGREDEHTCHH